MLARHAEAMFWAGRLLERAESTARMLDVTYHSQLESLNVDDSRSWLDLLKVLHLDMAFSATERPLTAMSVGEFLVFDPENPGTVLATVGQARENIRSVRELVSTEFWQSVNGFHLRLGTRDLRSEVEGEPYALYEFVRTQCQAVAGAVLETMPRDEGWQFLNLGWMLERAIMTCRLLAVRYTQLVTAGASGGFHHWISTLKSASGSEAFRRRYRASMDPADVVAFMLLSQTFPRSVLFSLRFAERNLERIVGTPDVRTRPQRLLGRLRSDVEYVDVHDLVAGELAVFLDRVDSDVRQVSDAIHTTYFRSSFEHPLHVLDPQALGR